MHTFWMGVSRTFLHVHSPTPMLLRSYILLSLNFFFVGGPPSRGQQPSLSNPSCSRGLFKGLGLICVPSLILLFLMPTSHDLGSCTGYSNPNSFSSLSFKWDCNSPNYRFFHDIDHYFVSLFLSYCLTTSTGNTWGGPVGWIGIGMPTHSVFSTPSVKGTPSGTLKGGGSTLTPLPLTETTASDCAN